MKERIQNNFTHVAAVILFVAALANLSGSRVLSEANLLVLNENDPVLPLTYRQVFIVWGSLQLLLSAYLLMGRSLAGKLIFVAFFALGYLSYRSSFSWNNQIIVPEYLGGLPAHFYVSPRLYNAGVYLIFLFLFLGSAALIIWRWLAGRNPKAPAAIEVHPQSSETESKVTVITRFKKLLYGWLAGIALATILMFGLNIRIKSHLPGNFNQMLDEISSVGELRKAPMINHAGTELVYLRNVETNVGSFIGNLATLKQSPPGAKAARQSVGIESFNIYGWSPDDRYLVFSWTQKPEQPNRQVGICDGVAGGLIRSFAAPKSVRQIAWLTTNSFVWLDDSYTLYVYNLNATTNLGKFGKNGMVKLRSISAVPRYYEDGIFSLARMSDHSIACVDHGNIWTLDITANKPRQLTRLTNNILEWLDYCPDNGQFLYCQTDKANSEFRRLYMFNPKAPADANTLLCSPHNTIFKGQWILNGNGIAYIDTIGSENCLTIDTKARALRTNLFLSGHVRSYSVAPSGEKVYAFASLDDGPMGIWEYDINKQKLRNVVPALEKPFAVSQVTVPVKTEVEGMGYFYLSPAHLDKNKKYPLVIDATRDSRWDSGAEILANAGIYYVSVNRDGMSSFFNFSTSPQDMLDACEEMLKLPNVDAQRVYLSGVSAGTRGMTELINNNPNKWRGAAFMSPISFPNLPPAPTNFPSLFISIPEKDGGRKATEDFTLEACRLQIPVTVVYHSRQSHLLQSNESIKERYEALAKFILLDQ